MKVDVMTGGLPLGEVQKLDEARAAGFAVSW